MGLLTSYSAVQHHPSLLYHIESLDCRNAQNLTGLMAKKRYCWIWPNDGKRQGTLGCVKDVVTGKGPDMHIGLLDRTWHLSRSRWSRWPEYDSERFWTDDALPPASHADRKNKRYDFRKRKYEDRPSAFFNDVRWSDVRWCADRKEPCPLEFRDAAGRWYWTHPPYSTYPPRRFTDRYCVY
jgi:hypothetical protein